MNSIIDLLHKNKEWLFSGLGISIIVVIYYLIKFIWNRKIIKYGNLEILSNTSLHPPQNASTNILETSFRQPNITPPQIYEAIKRVPLLQQEDIAKHYLGINVKWSGEVSFAYKKDDNIIRIALIYEGKLPPHYITFSMNLNGNREMSLLNENDLLEVEGIIESIDGRNITLNDIRIISWSRKGKSM